MASITVLIVEDNSILAMSMEEMLSNQGYLLMDPVATGKDAIQAVTDYHPDLILMDIYLRGEMSGITAAERIRALADIPVIFLTGYSQNSVIQQAKAASPYGYLVKPVAERELIATIETALYKHTLDQQIKASEARYRSLVEQASDGIFLVDEQGDILEANSAACMMIGYDHGEILRKNLIDLILPENLKADPLQLANLWDGRVVRKDRQFLRKDGTHFPVEITAKMVESGRFQGIVRDISERKIIDDTLLFLIQCGWVGSGEDFFESLARFLAEKLDMDYVSIDRLQGDQQFAQTIAIYFEGRWMDNVAYRLNDTPCADVAERGVCCFPRKVHQLFPQDAVLQSMLAESYIGVPLKNSARQTIGLITVIGRRPLEQTKTAEAVLELVALRAAGELERKRSDDALRKSEEKFSSTFRISPDGISITRFSDGKFLEINQAYSDLTGYSSKDLVGMSSVDIQIWDGEWSRERFLEEIRENGEVANLDFKIRTRSGEIKNCLVSSRPIEIEGEKCLLSFTKDISERKRIEEALRTSEEMYRSITLISPDITMLQDLNGNISFISPQVQQITGYAPEELLGRTETMLVYPQDIEKVQEGFWSGLQQGKLTDLEYRMIGKNGEIIWVSHTASPVGIENQACYLQSTIRDITERMRALEEIKSLNADLDQRVQDRTAQLLAANQELEAFAYSVSHDLRTPLRALAGFSNALNEDYRDLLDSHGQDYLRRIEDASVRMGQLMDDLLSLSRITRLDFSRQTVDLSALYDELCAGYRNQNPCRQFEIAIMPGMVVQADPHLVRIALDNLINNAFKFTAMREVATIHVGVKNEFGRLVYFVKDNGAGFNMAYASKLFAPFHRLHSINDFPGTGIGLVIVQRIITRHGGQVWVDAEVDRGATFYFTLSETESEKG
jgi:PAS domain S-box-containing protein